jgi:hypothetical protein
MFEYVLPLIWDTTFPTHTNQVVNCTSSIYLTL